MFSILTDNKFLEKMAQAIYFCSLTINAMPLLHLLIIIFKFIFVFTLIQGYVY